MLPDDVRDRCVARSSEYLDNSPNRVESGVVEGKAVFGRSLLTGDAMMPKFTTVYMGHSVLSTAAHHLGFVLENSTKHKQTMRNHNNEPLSKFK